MLIGFDASRINIGVKTGIENYSTKLLHWLKKNDHKNQYLLYTPNDNDPEFLDLPPNFHIKKFTFPFFWTQLRLAWCLLFCKQKPDLVFVPSNAIPFLFILFNRRIKKVVTIHDVAFKYFPSSYSFINRFYLNLSIIFSVKFADKIITISQTTKNDLIKFYGADEKKIEVTYLGFAAGDEEIKKEDVERTKEKFGINKEYLFYLGRIETKKNIVNLVRAFYELLSEEYDLQLVLAGKKGFGFEKIEEVLKELNVKDRVIITGYVNEKERQVLLENSSALTFVSLYEGFGIPVLDSFSAGVPVVLSKIPVFEELYSKASILVDPQDVQEIKEGIKKVLENKKTRERLIKSGKELLKNFSWEKCARETLEILGLMVNFRG